MSSAAFRSGLREAFGVQAGVLAASFVGFGALASASGVSVWFAMASTLTLWALPAQIVMIEMWQLGAPMIAVVLAVMLTNARFLPMTVTLMAVVRAPLHPRWAYYVAVQGISMSSWVMCMRHCPDMPAAERLAYFAGTSCGIMAVSVGAAAAGYLVADAIPVSLRMGLVFLAPVYFFVFLIVEVRTRLTAIAIICGGLAGPLFHLLTPQWSLLMAGFIGGTAAFAIHKFLGRTHA